MTRWLEPIEFTAVLFTVGLPAWMAAGLALCSGLAAAVLLQNHTAAVRSWCFRATLLVVTVGALLACARLDLPAPANRVPGPAPFTSNQALAHNSRELRQPHAASDPHLEVGETRPSPAATIDWVTPACVTLTVLWITGACVILGRLLLGMFWLRRLRQDSLRITTGPVAESVARLCASAHVPVPDLRCASQVSGPFVSGVFHSTLWLPEYFYSDLDLQAQNAVLAHEIAHVRRRDNAWMLAAEILTAALWLQPLMWLLRSQLRDTADEACDAGVLQLGFPARTYADALIGVSQRLRAGVRDRALGSAVVPFRSSLARRIEQVLAGAGARSAFRPRHTVVSTLLVLVALAGSTAVGAMAPPSPAPGSALKSGVTTTDARPLSLDEAQKMVPFKLFVPSQIQDSRVLGARYTATKISDPRAVRDFLGERERSGMFYGLMLEFKGGKTLVRAAAKSAAADAGVPNQFVEVVSVNGFRPQVPDQHLTQKLPRPKQAEALKKEGDLLMRMRAEPLKLLLRVRGKERSVLIPKRRKVTFAVQRPAIIRPKSAVILLEVPAAMELQEGLFPVALIQTPSTVPANLPDVQPPAHLPKNVMRRGPYGKRAWIRGSERSPSAVYWTSEGLDYWLNNPQYLLKLHQILEIMRQTGYKTPPTTVKPKVPSVLRFPIQPYRPTRGH